jgi:hypothetical protein
MDPYTVDGTQKGTFKVVDNFSFLRIFEAGHMVPFYRMSCLIISRLAAVVLTRCRAGSFASSVQPDHAQAADFLDVIR